MSEARSCSAQSLSRSPAARREPRTEDRHTCYQPPDPLVAGCPPAAPFLTEGTLKDTLGALRGAEPLSLGPAVAGLSRRAADPTGTSGHGSRLGSTPGCCGEEAATLLNRESLQAVRGVPGSRGCPEAAAPAVQGVGCRRGTGLCRYFWRTDAFTELSRLWFSGRPRGGEPVSSRRAFRSRGWGRQRGSG